MRESKNSALRTDLAVQTRWAAEMMRWLLEASKHEGLPTIHDVAEYLSRTARRAAWVSDEAAEIERVSAEIARLAPGEGRPWVMVRSLIDERRLQLVDLAHQMS